MVLPRHGIIYSFFEISWGLAGNTAHGRNTSPALLFGIIVMREFCAEVSDEEPQKEFRGLAISLVSHTVWWSVAENSTVLAKLFKVSWTTRKIAFHCSSLSSPPMNLRARAMKYLLSNFLDFKTSSQNCLQKDCSGYLGCMNSRHWNN